MTDRELAEERYLVYKRETQPRQSCRKSPRSDRRPLAIAPCCLPSPTGAEL